MPERSHSIRMRGRLIGSVLALAAAASLLVPSPAHAGGGFTGNGPATSGCAGGQISIEAVAINGSQWVFDVNATCVGFDISQHVVLAGAWLDQAGGPVHGIGTGTLNIGAVPCTGGSNVSIDINMLGLGLISGKFSTSFRACT